MTSDRKSGVGTAYFESAEVAVKEITRLLVAKDWPVLAGYYDLSGSDIDRATLVSGEFFTRKTRPELSHPAVNWRIKGPFPPNFSYQSTASTVEPDVKRVRVGIEIATGADTPIQEGSSEFCLRKHPEGYQVLPGRGPDPWTPPPLAAPMDPPDWLK